MENQAKTITHEPNVTASDLENIFAELRFNKMPSLDVLLEMLQKVADEAEQEGFMEVHQVESVVKRIYALIQASKTVYSGICHEVYMLEEAVNDGMDELERLASRLYPERSYWPHTVIVFASDDGYDAYLEDAIVCAGELRRSTLRHGLAPHCWIKNRKELDFLAKKLNQKGYRVKVLSDPDGEDSAIDQAA